MRRTVRHLLGFGEEIIRPAIQNHAPASKPRSAPRRKGGDRHRSLAEPAPALAKCWSTSERWFFVLAGAKSRTTRDGTSPCSRRSKIWLIEERGCSSISALTLPPTAKRGLRPYPGACRRMNHGWLHN